MSLANLKATTEYQEAIQATEDLESPAVGFAKTSDYKGGLAVQVNAVIKQNNTLLYLATKQSQKLIELEEKFDKLKQEIHTIIEKEVQPADLEDSISSLAKRLDSFSISGKLPIGHVTNDFINFEGVFDTKLNNEEAMEMVKEITHEIENAIFNIGHNKALGPNGYTSTFFKKAWKIVGNDVCIAIKEFFTTEKLLAEMNATIISLIPKISTPKKLVNLNQSAFIQGRVIQDNILITQELLKGCKPLSGGLRGKEDQLSAKHQLAVKGLSEYKTSKSNARRIQVKDIVKEVEDHLKTYSSAGMDISLKIVL
ncbi:hypothetical protein Tco_0627516 [Tanacetum coccineum]|uniref:Uncharacterized protein n=1 Tax=Tanacetum coccineum TaxID=301880 RepID=A0ABQ4WMN6_9ASTR